MAKDMEMPTSQESATVTLTLPDQIATVLQASQDIVQILFETSLIAQHGPGLHASVPQIVNTFRDAASTLNTLLLTLAPSATTGAQVRQGRRDGHRAAMKTIHEQRGPIFEAWRSEAAK
jgi:hypothetical protein